MDGKRFFFFDYDGTLAIPLSKTIPFSTRKAIKELQRRGHFVALATGRLQCNALDYIDSLGLDNIVADGGYSVTLGGQLKWMQPLDLAMCQNFLRRLDAAGVPWAVQRANEHRRWTSSEAFCQASEDYYLPTEVDPQLTIESLKEVYKVYVPCCSGDIPQLVASGLLDGVPWISYGTNAVFVEPMEKAVGIRKAMDMLGAPCSQVVVFGDGKNDLSMFCPEWCSIAMGNAVPQLKAVADYITTSCDDDGIWNACRHFGWI